MVWRPSVRESRYFHRKQNRHFIVYNNVHFFLCSFFFLLVRPLSGVCVLPCDAVCPLRGLLRLVIIVVVGAAAVAAAHAVHAAVKGQRRDRDWRGAHGRGAPEEPRTAPRQAALRCGCGARSDVSCKKKRSAFVYRARGPGARQRTPSAACQRLARYTKRAAARHGRHQIGDRGARSLKGVSCLGRPGAAARVHLPAPWRRGRWRCCWPRSCRGPPRPWRWRP